MLKPRGGSPGVPGGVPAAGGSGEGGKPLSAGRGGGGGGAWLLPTGPSAAGSSRGRAGVRMSSAGSPPFQLRFQRPRHPCTGA